jgi:phospholipid/cholesterol/gamma-HCH transport system substrate-binding protein
MEIRARYTLIGLFTLSAILAGFAFVYWLNNAGGLTQQAVYRVRYENTVSGLLKGSAVLFNGIRVGEVSALELNSDNPKQVVAVLSVDRTTPVRADTKAGIEFQGLMGAPVVSLRGGSAAAAQLASSDGMAPLMIADPEAGQNMTEAARSVLRNIDTVVTQNSEPLKGLITNINTFSAVLSKNSERIDGILGGLERMTGGGKKSTANVFDLAAPRSLPTLQKIPAGQLVVPEPELLGSLFNDEMIVKDPKGERNTTLNGKWPDTISRVLQSRIIQSFENANYLNALGRQPDNLKVDYQLLLDLRNFQVVTDAEPYAELEFSAKIVAETGEILGAKIFKTRAPTKAASAADVAAGLNSVFAKLVTELVVWTCQTI